MIHTGPTLHSTRVWYMQYLQVWNTPSPSNPYLLWSGNQRRGTLSFTRMQFFGPSHSDEILNIQEFQLEPANIEHWVRASALNSLRLFLFNQIALGTIMENAT